MAFRFKSNTKHRPIRSGCGFALLVMVTVIALLVINSMLTTQFYNAVMPHVDSRVVAPLRFSSTILLVCFQYWLYDQVVKRLSKK